MMCARDPGCSAGSSSKQSGWLAFSLGLLAGLMLCFAMLGSGRVQAQSLAVQVPSPNVEAPPGEGDEPYDNATLITYAFPISMEVGKSYSVTVTLRNTGTTIWSQAGAHPHRLGYASTGTPFGIARVELGSNTVAPGAIFTFSFIVTAPATTGNYDFAWQMLTEGDHWFGPVALRSMAVVAPAPVYDAQITGMYVPTSMVAGNVYSTWITFKNTGNTTWTKASGFRLGTSSPVDNMFWGMHRVELEDATVVPGASTTVHFNVTAPVTAGAYVYDWGMLWEGQRRFGWTSNIPVTVSAPPSMPTISITRPPLVAGQAVTMTWSTTNATSLTRVCTATGTGYAGSESLPLSGSRSITPLAAWVNYPSNCTWTATGAGGSTAYADTMTTTAASASNVTYIHTDALGSPVARTNSTGSLISRTAYEPYGYTASGEMPTIGFTGHVNDGDTGLTYMQQRYYDPVAGRFLSIDPVVTDANTGGSFNRYAYANNSPYKYVDPDGRDSEVTWNSAGTAVNIKIPFAISDPAGVARFTPSQVATEVGNRLSGNVVIGGVAVTVTTVGVPVPLDSPSVANGSANVITVRPALGRSSTNKIGGNRINLRGTADAKVVTHELAHSAKAGDQYPGGVDAAGKVFPSTATQTTNNIMGDGTGAANAQTLREMAGPRPPPSSTVSKDF